LPEQWKESIIVPTYKKGDKTDCSNYRGISFLSTTYKILANLLSSKVNSKCRGNYWGSSVWITGQLLIIYSAFIKYLRRKRKYREAVHQLFIDFKKTYDSVRREFLYKILIEFGITAKLVRLIKMCLNETYSRVWVSKHLPRKFPIMNSFKQDDLSPLLFNFALEYAIRRVQAK
jgi:hypothetical protein